MKFAPGRAYQDAERCGTSGPRRPAPSCPTAPLRQMEERVGADRAPADAWSSSRAGIWALAPGACIAFTALRLVPTLGRGPDCLNN